MNAPMLTDQIKQAAHDLGFDRVGVCAAVAPPGVERFDRWLEEGYAGTMHYLPSRREAYQHPRHVMDGVRSIVVLTMNYRTIDPATPQAGQGRVSRYAWGSDYHDVIHERLKRLVAKVDELVPDSDSRGVVDTAPLLERDLAQLAGLGWIGKNTMLLNRDAGSWFFLAALLTSVELQYDRPQETDHCGTCTACLDVCPTDAFPQPYVLDATRCISYLTIELRQAIPRELREGVGDWLFGCDDCQDVCPWNHRAPVSEEPAFGPADSANPMDLVELFSLDQAAFRERFRHTPLWRSKRRGLLRNAAIVLGNRPTDAALPALACGLNDEEPLVRGACAWALGKFATSEASQILCKRLAVEAAEEVCEEIKMALDES
ncbi:MAG: tRNA epoxyqueuosine(34) reductase QueG [Planctomycetes bacterium]|nr:tRNA epoxyqueuosine(34) reductase QueG [Planctomycetota bacterium]